MAISRKQVEDILSKESENEQKVTDLLNMFHASEEDWKRRVLNEKERADNLQAKADEDEKLVNKLKKDEKDNEALQETLSQRDERIKTLEAELVTNQIKASAQLRAVSEGAINPDIVVSQLDLDLVKQDKDGNLIGLDEQFKNLKEGENTAFLFKTEEPKAEPKETPQQKNDYVPGDGSETKGVSLGKLAAQRYLERHKSTESQDSNNN